MVQEFFRITEDGYVHRSDGFKFESLGHIGSILHENNRSGVATRVRAWWNALLAAEEPIKTYVLRNESVSLHIHVPESVLVVPAAIDRELAEELAELVATD